MAISVDYISSLILEHGCEYLPNIAEYLAIRVLVRLILMLGNKAQPTAGVPLYSTGFEVVEVEVSRFSRWSQTFGSHCMSKSSTLKLKSYCFMDIN